MSITAVGICGELLLDNKSVGAEKAPAVQVKNVEAQSVKTTAATEVYDFVKFKKSRYYHAACNVPYGTPVVMYYKSADK